MIALAHFQSRAACLNILLLCRPFESQQYIDIIARAHLIEIFLVQYVWHVTHNKVYPLAGGDHLEPLVVCHQRWCALVTCDLVGQVG